MTTDTTIHTGLENICTAARQIATNAKYKEESVQKVSKFLTSFHDLCNALGEKSADMAKSFTVTEPTLTHAIDALVNSSEKVPLVEAAHFLNALKQESHLPSHTKWRDESIEIFLGQELGKLVRANVNPSIRGKYVKLAKQITGIPEDALRRNVGNTTTIGLEVSMAASRNGHPQTTSDQLTSQKKEKVFKLETVVGEDDIPPAPGTATLKDTPAPVTPEPATPHAVEATAKTHPSSTKTAPASRVASIEVPAAPVVSEALNTELLEEIRKKRRPKEEVPQGRFKAFLRRIFGRRDISEEAAVTAATAADTSPPSPVQAEPAASPATEHTTVVSSTATTVPTISPPTHSSIPIPAAPSIPVASKVPAATPVPPSASRKRPVWLEKTATPSTPASTPPVVATTTTASKIETEIDFAAEHGPKGVHVERMDKDFNRITKAKDKTVAWVKDHWPFKRGASAATAPATPAAAAPPTPAVPPVAAASPPPVIVTPPATHTPSVHTPRSTPVTPPAARPTVNKVTTEVETALEKSRGFAERLFYNAEGNISKLKIGGIAAGALVALGAVLVLGRGREQETPGLLPESDRSR